MSIKFWTHRMLVRATEEHNYEMIDIDMNNGNFRRVSVKMTETKIRVNKSILGEILSYGGVHKKAMQLPEVAAVAEEFNKIRVVQGFAPLQFRTTEEKPDDSKVREASKVQGQKRTKARVRGVSKRVHKDAHSSSNANPANEADQGQDKVQPQI